MKIFKTNHNKSSYKFGQSLFTYLFILDLLLIILPFPACSKLIPFKPNLELLKDFMARGETMTLKGTGLIQNLDTAYKIRLMAVADTSLLPIDLEVLSVEAEEVNVLIPEDISYGDYKIEFQLKSRYLKTPKLLLANILKIRPQAVTDFSLKADVLLKAENLTALLSGTRANDFKLILNSNDVDEEVDSMLEQGDSLSLDANLSREALKQKIIGRILKLGLNSAQVYTVEDGFKSLLTTSVNFYYLPLDVFQQELFISLNPFSVVMKQNFTNKSFDVTSVIKKEQQGLTTTYYLKAFEKPYYLSRSIEASALGIEKMRVIGDEFAVIKNLGINSFKLRKCRLADLVKTRFEFTQDIELVPEAAIIVNGDLGLNNTGTDFLSLSCEIDQGTGLKYVLIDQFSYSKTNEEGFAVRDLL
ncbi:MAG: hypothetical protein VKK32_04330 [Candidatus Melainabacteria bacterium]|nr:hypothetical protein [Candidatus Melainabacteria bacterium]